MGVDAKAQIQPEVTTVDLQNVATQTHYITREQALNVALNIGKVLLKSGAETSRVEDTIARFCRSFGYTDVNVFATPTMIIIGDETTANASLMCRIRYRSNNLSNVKAINDFSYGIKPETFNYDEAMSLLHGLLQSKPPYGKWTCCLASAVCSAAFASMLGGNSHDFLAAFVTGGMAMVFLRQLDSFGFSAFWENAVAGAAIGALAISCCAVSVQCTRTNIIVGSLMPFLPGLAFTNGLRDYLSGDLISGNSRIAEALLFAVSIAFGLAFVLLLWYRWGWDLWPTMR